MLKIFTARSEFIKNISKLVAGNTIAQAISLIAAPVITRLYTPADVGAFTFFLSIAGGVGLIATLRYEMAIVLPKEEKEAVNLAFIALMIAGGLAIIFTGLLLSFSHLFFAGTTSVNLVYHGWIYLLPVMSFLMALSNIFLHWFNRQKQYHSLAASKVITSAGNNLLTILMGYLGFGALGLWLGNFTGLLLGNLLFIIIFAWRYRKTMLYFDFSMHKALLRKYQYLAIANTPQVIIEMVQSYGIIYLIRFFFSASVLGWFSLAQRLLQAPMYLIGYSIGNVFYKEGAEKFQNEGSLFEPLMKTIKTAALIAFPVLLIMLTIGPWLMSTIFGDSWREAGQYARILAPWMFFEFIRAAIHPTPLILGKIRQMFYISIVGSVMIVIPVIVGGLYFKSGQAGFMLLSATQSLYAISVIFWIIRIAGKSKGNKISEESPAA